MQTRSFRREVLSARVGLISLGPELDQLQRVREADAHPAVVFYCARILEAVCAAALDAAAREQVPNVFAGLARLEELGLLQATQSAFFHALRRLGNEVRHLHRHLDARDADVSVALLQRVLDWYFVSAAHGPRLPSVVDPHAAADLAGEEAPAPTLLGLRYLEEERHEDLLALWEAEPEALLASPVLAGLCAELLISLGVEQRARARELVARARERFPDALRPRQLQAWLLRLEGDHEASLSALQTLQAEYPDDLETLGLLAGTHKRLWAAPGTAPKARPGHLKRARALYLRAWRASKRTHTYSGINAATLHLLGGDAPTARQLGAEVEALLSRRQAAAASYWDRATLAEALLLQGRLAEARAAYHAAFAAHPDRQEWRRSTEDQLALILPCLGVEPDAARFLAARAPAWGEERPLRVGLLVDGDPGEVAPLLDACRGAALGRILLSRTAVLLRASLASPGARALCQELLASPHLGLEAQSPGELDEWLESLAPAERAAVSSLLALAHGLSTDPALQLGERPGDDVARAYDALLVVEGAGSAQRALPAVRALAAAGLPVCTLRLVGQERWEVEEERAERLSEHLARATQAHAYRPEPLRTSHVALPTALDGLVEALAEHVHDSWASQRLAEGWTYGPRRSDELRQHPCLVPYAELTEEEKGYDRLTVTQTLKAILSLGFEVGRTEPPAHDPA